MDIYNDVSYKKIPSDDECILNAVAMGKIIDESASTVRLWGDMYEEFLYIKKINGRLTYTEASIHQFKFIKELIREKKFSHKQIYDHISKTGFKYKKYDSGLVNPDDPLGFEVLATQLMLKNQEMMKEFFVNFAEYQENLKEELKSEIRNEVAVTIDEHIENKLDEFKSYLDQRELEQKQRDVEMIDSLKTHIEDTKKKVEEGKNKGFFKRLFKL